jgi:CheY-like chemotaxis protein
VESLAMERRDLRPAGQEQQRPSILVVEDEPIEAEQMILLFEDEGFRAHLAANLEGALDVIGRERVDLIISDHYLENTTGVEVLSSLRRLFPDVPRIMVSGAEEQDVVSEAVNRGGIRAFLRKPVNPDELIQVARGLLEEAVRGR